MSEKFKPKDDPQFPFWKEMNEELIKKYKDKLPDIEKAIDANMSIKEFLELFDEVIIVLGNNDSGIDIAKLDTMEIDSWSW